MPNKTLDKIAIDKIFPRAPLAFAVAFAAQAAMLAPVAFADGIETVTVTAQKREQSLQETPIAISALTSEALEQQDIRDVAALNGMVPNLRLASSPGNANGATINIRGAVTINPALTMEPTVGLYLDGIYIGKNVGGVFDVADLERVEVLRGPQGSLYGKNTLGGAINLITKKPSGVFGGDLRLTAGNYGLTSVKTSIDAPAVGTIGEGFGKLSAKVAYTATNRRGFIDNVESDAPGALPPSGRDFGNVHSRSGRAALLWQPIDNLEVMYSYDFSRSEQRPRFYQITRLNQAAIDQLTTLTGQPSVDLTPFASSRRLEKGSVNGGTADNAYIDGHGLTISWDAGNLGALGDVTFKSLTGHRQTRAEDDLDWDVTPYALLETGRNIGYRSTSQELQMIGKTERVNYVVGLYYFKESGHTSNPLDLPLFPTPNPLTPGSFIPSPLLDSRYGLDNDARAVFAQIDWTPPILDDRLKFTAGGRYTRESKQIERSFAIPAFGLTLLDNETFDKDYSNFSPTGIVSYQWTDTLNTYFKVAKGWKAGVFNAESSDLNELQNPIKPEIVTSFELGMKSRWLDNRLEANLAFFYDQHKDMQISRFDQASAQSSFTNAGKAHIQGAELELIAIPIDNLQVSVSYGYIDATYDKYMDTCRATATGAVNCDGHAPGTEFDAKDVNKFAYTPKNTANVGVQYTQALPIGEAVGRIDWSYTDKFAIYPDPYNYENTSIDSYQLVDARLTWDKIPVQKTEAAVSVWVKNLTDKQYRINGIEWGPFTTMNYGDPRTFGVDVAVKF